jgi:hypothetical protein
MDSVEAGHLLPIGQFPLIQHFKFKTKNISKQSKKYDEVPGASIKHLTHQIHQTLQSPDKPTNKTNFFPQSVTCKLHLV